eukprot:TRINITY_DN6562_c0_g2_i1.p1 TRINITY_DN6562_c0_g2~~TRINITY_DN6562_c0_g2_i1.p1  ORF type:complete len:256 (+),score=17.41 TRINITY_DN6562_c0_g2_i1:1690-2457(+)
MAPVVAHFNGGSCTRSMLNAEASAPHCQRNPAAAYAKGIRQQVDHDPSSDLVPSGSSTCSTGAHHAKRVQEMSTMYGCTAEDFVRAVRKLSACTLSGACGLVHMSASAGQRQCALTSPCHTCRRNGSAPTRARPAVPPGQSEGGGAGCDGAAAVAGAAAAAAPKPPAVPASGAANLLSSKSSKKRPAATATGAQRRRRTAAAAAAAAPPGSAGSRTQSDSLRLHYSGPPHGTAVGWADMDVDPPDDAASPPPPTR